MTTSLLFRSATARLIASALLAGGLALMGWALEAPWHGVGTSPAPTRPASANAMRRLGRQGRLTISEQPLSFEPNGGQADPSILFLSRGPGYDLRLDARGAALTLRRQQQAHTIRLDLAGASRAAAITPEQPLPGRIHYLLGRDQRRWIRNVPTYERVRYASIYPGIDLVLYGNQRRLEYDFAVAGNADPSNIALGFRGADRLQIDPAGQLLVHVGGRALEQAAPVAYQDRGGRRVAVSARYRLRDAAHVGIDLGSYDHSRPLVIDPLVLGWSTYLGGQGDDWVEASALNSKGELVVVGGVTSSEASWLFTTFNQGPLGSLDAFVSRFKADGTLLSTTFFGGGGDDIASAVAIDPSDNIYITGTTTSITFPTTANAAMPESESLQVSLKAGIPFLTLLQAPDIGTAPVGDADAFVMKLDPTGLAPKYSSYLGGSPDVGAKLTFEPSKVKIEFDGNPGIDRGFGIAVDAAQNAYVVGQTDSEAFPVTADAFKSSPNGFLGAADGFITKIDTTASGVDSIKFSSYLGGSCDDDATGVALDGQGHVYVTGDTSTSFVCGGFGTTAGAANPNGLGGQDAWVMSLILNDHPGAVFSTFIGTSGDDFGGRVGVDPFNNVYASYVAADSTGTGGQLHVVQLSLDGTRQNWDRTLGETNRSGAPVVFVKTYPHDLFTPGSNLLAPIFAVGNAAGPNLYQLDKNGTVTFDGLGLGGALTWAESIAADARRVIVSGGTTSDSLNPLSAAQGTRQGGADAFTADYVYNPPPKVTGKTIAGLLEGTFFDSDGTAVVATFPVTSGTGEALYDETIDWGDGSRVDVRNAVVVSGNGDAGIGDAHAYGRAGSYTGTACVQQEGTTDAPQCGQFTVQVLNVAPTVSADPTTTATITADTPGVTFAPSGSGVTLTASTLADFFDPGFLESHTATIVWDSGLPPETAQISQAGARGTIVNASHVYAAGGNKSVTVCVADQFNASGCTTLTIEMPSADLHTTSNGPESAAACSTIDYDIKVSNTGPDTAQNVVVQHTLSDPANMSYASTMMFGGAGDGTIANGAAVVNDSGAGAGVAIDGSTAVVTGASAHIIERDPVTFGWRQTAQFGTLAGQAAAIQGDWIVLARKGFNTSPTDHTPGYAEVYHRVNGSWTGPVQTLRPTDTDATFGSAVSIGGGTIAIADDEQNSAAGAVYIYGYDGTQWNFQSKIAGLMSDGRLGEGVAVSRDGTIVAAGAPGERIVASVGGVNVYQRATGTTVWSLETFVLPPPLIGFQEFGASLAFDEGIDSPRLAVGAPQTDGVGFVYVYQFVGGTTQALTTLVPNDFTIDGQFGRSVAISSNRILVGASSPFGVDPDPSAQNRAYVFSPASDGTWGQVGRFVPAEHPEASQYFGSAVGISGGAIVIGAPGGITFKTPDGQFETDSLGYADVYSSCMQPTGAGSISCDVGSLAPGQSAEFLLSVKLGSGLNNGANASATGSASSGALDPYTPDNTATTTTTVTGHCGTDATPPIVAPVVAGHAGHNGWYVGGPVNVSWNVSDPESAISSTHGCDATTISDDTDGTTLTCTATSQGGTTTKSVTIRLDTQPPVITEGTPFANPDNPGETDVPLTCTDPTRNGVASGVQSCFNGTTGLDPSAGIPSYTLTFSDVAGNTTTVPFGVPTVTIGAPQTVSTTGGACTAAVTLSGAATDPFNRTLQYSWSESGTVLANTPQATVSLAPGIHNLALTATTPDGFSTSSATRVTVIAGTPPVLTNVTARVFADATGAFTPVTVPTPTVTGCGAIQLTNDAPASGFLSGDTNVFFTATDVNGLSATAATLVTVRPQVDVGVSIPAPTLVSGTSGAITFDVANKGPSHASNIVVTPTLPDGLTPIAIDSGATSCVSDGNGGQTCSPILVLSKDALCLNGAGGLQCTIGGLDSGASTSFALTFALPANAAPGTQTIGAAATPAETDTNSADNATTATLAVTAQSDLAVSIAAPSATVAGSDAVYTLSVTNAGPSYSASALLTSPLPAGVSFKSGAGCRIAQGAVSCPVGLLAPGASASFPVTVTVASASRGTLALSAQLAGSDQDPNLANNQASATAPIQAQVSVSAALTPSGALVAGQTGSMMATISNAGPSDATGVVIAVGGLHQGVSVTSAPAGCSQLPNHTGFSCPATTLPSGAGATNLPFTLTVDQFVRGSIAVTLTVSDAEEASAHVVQPLLPVNVSVHPALTVQASPSPAVAGSSLTYTISATNSGPSGATGGQLAIPVPAGTTLTAASGVYFAQGLDAGVSMPCSGTSTVGCIIPTLGVGDRAIVTVTVSVATGAAAHQSSLTGAAALIVAESSTPATADLSVALTARADLTLSSITAQTPSAVAGSDVLLTATIANNGPSDASSAQMVVALPADHSWTAPASQSAGCAADAAAITCAIGALTSGAQASHTFVVHVDPFWRQPLQVTARAAAAETDPDTSNNSASVSVQTTAQAAVSVDLSASPNPAIAGRPLSYTLRVTNVGPSGATGLVATMTPPDGTSPETLPAGCTVAQRLISCTLSNLGPQTHMEVNLTTNVDQFARGINGALTATAGARAVEMTADASATLTTPLTTLADASVTVSAAPNPIVAGTFLTYTVTVLNGGPSGAIGATLTQTLPTGVLYVSGGGTGASCAFSHGTVTCGLPTLASGDSIVLKIIAVPSTAGLLSSTATVNVVETDPDLSNNSAGAITTVSSPASGPAGLGDFNGDGALDLAISDPHQDIVHIFLNDGHGHFVEHQQVAVGHKPAGVAIGDLDGDGDLDIVVADQGSDAVSILTNDGTGTFVETARLLTLGQEPVQVALGDFDGDGRLDIAAVNFQSDDVSLFGQDATGTWQLRRRLSVVSASGSHAEHHPETIAVADLNGDGMLDIAVGNQGPDSVSRLFNAGGWQFAPASEIALQFTDDPAGLAVADYDGDGHLDIAVAGKDRGQISLLVNTNGAFAETVITAPIEDRPVAIAAGDLNGDGRIDLVVAAGDDAAILMNAGSAFPASLATTLDVSQKKAIALMVGDINGDGVLDIIMVDDKVTVRVWTLVR